MGLDMYLERLERNMIPFKQVDLEEVREVNPELFKQLEKYGKKKGNPEFFQWYSLFEDVGYWRKANHIHQWFVDNVQDGEDDCLRHMEVTKEKLDELLDVCKTVLTEKDESVSNELLPTQSGFFFGCTDYDDGYYEDIERTIEIVNDAINTTDFSKQALFYRSSW